jgi:hypothetical protein
MAAPQSEIEPQYRPIRMAPLDGGIVDNQDESSPTFKDSQTRFCQNVDFDRGSVATARGMRKFGNQVAPGGGLRFRADPALPPLFIESGKAVPVRGYAHIPYNQDTDIGGRFDFEGTFPSSDTYHNRRGRSFQRDISFRIPPEEKLFEANTRGSAAPATNPAGFTPPHGFDEALDECFVLWQKGGDGNPPMSVGLGVVNIGSLSQADTSGTQAPASRPSNYALCFIWFDAPAWARPAPSIMDYNLTSGFLPTDGANGGQHSTQAFRALLIHQFVEPGKTYHVSVQLKLDSGTQGGIATNTAWQNDGYFKVWVREDRKKTLSKFTAIDSGSGVTLNGMEVWKGPQDSARYLTKYGIRFAGRDATFVGLGFRNNPWQKASFIPWGMDAAPLVNGGFRMVDRSANTTTALYGGGVYTLTATKIANGDAFVQINHGGFSDGNTNGGFDPMAIWGGAVYTSWLGQGNAAGTVPFNSEALRGYRLVATNDWTPGAPAAKGAVFSILSYARVGGPLFQVTIQGGATINAFAAQPILVQAFRWHQRPIEACELRTWAAPRDYEDPSPLIAARRKLSLGMSLRLDDATEPDIANLLERYAMDDCGGTVIRETVRGGARNGYLCPQGLGISEGGTRGKNLLFLSGEGEKVAIDFSTNPIVKRVVESVLASGTQGFAMELTCIFTEAYYGIMGVGESLPDLPASGLSGSRPRFAPEIMSWDVKDAVGQGSKAVARPIMALTFRGLSSDISSARFKRPLAPSVEIASFSDQEDVDPIVPSDLLSWYTAGGLDVARYDQNAGWVGKPVTLQVGFQPVIGSTDTYDVYLAMTPKDVWNPQSGDAGDAEFAYFTAGGGTYDVAYKTAAHFTIKKKDIFRSIITIGGKHNPRGLGMHDISARMLLDEVRIFATSGPGTLPATNGAANVTRDGKLEGTKCLPPRVLSADELLLPLGRNAQSVNVTERSTNVTPAGSGRFFPGLASASIDAADDCIMSVGGDETLIPAPETDGSNQSDVYRIESVAADGSSLTLATPYAKPSRLNARADSLRTIGYTAFADDISERALTVGTGKGYDPAVSTVADVILSEDMWANETPIDNNFKVHVFPLGVSIQDTLPKWVRGLVSPRRGKTGEGIIGLHTQDSTIYAAVRGSIYRAYDRWVDAQPTASISHGLEFIAEKNRSADFAGLSVPQHDDRIEFESPSGWIVSPSLTDATVTYLDWRGRVDEFQEYQTIVWVGARDTDPAKFAGNTAGLHKVYVILRLNRGRPEIAFGSTAFYTGTTQPEKGLFIATGSAVVPRSADVHVRFGITTRALGTIMQVPFLWVNGKVVPVAVNAKDNDASITQATDWLRMSTLVQPGDSGIAFVGAARDSYRAAPSAQIIASAGEQLRGQRIQGIIHGFAGTLYECVVHRAAVWSGSAPNFDPYLPIAATDVMTFSILGQAAEGRGAKVKDVASGQYGVIRSSPFISVFHEMGESTSPVEFANFNADVYATNGGRPVLIADGIGRPAGVQPPTTKPAFTITRLPLWQTNFRDKTSSGNPANDPLDANPVAGAFPRYHYRADGNSYLGALLTDAGDQAAMMWAKDKYFGFKCFWRPQQVSGRQSIFRKGSSKESGGPYLECRDGHLYFGWHDIDLKEDEDVHTDIPVFKAGECYYINVRKRWPNQDGAEGNFENSYFSDGRIRRWTLNTVVGTGFTLGETIKDNTTTLNVGRVVLAYPNAYNTVEIVLTGVVPVGHAITGNSSGTTANYVSQTRPMHDIVVVKHMPKTFISDVNLKDPLDFTPGAHRSDTSFTSNAISPAGCTATGLVTLPGLSYTGAAAGIVNSDVGNVFTPDMIGMYFQFGSGALAGVLYRVQTFNSLSQIKVADPAGAFPNLAGQVNASGGVFSGVNLVKSARFDASKSPDVMPTTVEMFGSSNSADPVNGLVPGLCEFWCPGYTVSPVAAGGTNGQIFENVDTSATGAVGSDPLHAGTDSFPFALYDGLGGQCEPLRCDDNKAFYVTDMRTYAGGALMDGTVTTQPASDRKVPKDPHAPNTNPTCTSTDTARPTFNYLQDPATWAGDQFIAVAFRDPVQNVISNPGPPPDPESNILRISPANEDTTNPAGLVRVNLKALPASRDAGDIEVLVFRSLQDGDSTVEFEVLRLPSGTAEASMNPLELIVTQGAALEFDNGAPPACLIVGLMGGRMIYAGLTDLGQLDGLYFSKPFEPAKVPGGNFLRVNTGPGSAITGLQEINGQIIVAKRDDIFTIAFDPQTGLPSQNKMSGGASCTAPQSLVTVDQQVFMRGDRGIYVVQYHAYQLNLFSAWASQNLQRFFAELVDKLAASSSSAATNRRRNQYVLTTKLDGHSLTDHRVALMPGKEPVFGRYQDPNLTALASVQPANGGPRQLIGGSEEGFVFWMDDDSTPFLGIGPDQGADGSVSLTVLDGSTSAVRFSVGALDADLEGARGLPLRWLAGNTRMTASILGVQDGVLLLDSVASGVPSGPATIGGQEFSWETKFVDMGNFEKRKLAHYVDLAFSEGSTGRVRLDFFLDRDNTKVDFTVRNLDVSQQRVSEKLNRQGDWHKMRITNEPLSVGGEWELNAVVWRAGETDQR